MKRLFILLCCSVVLIGCMNSGQFTQRQNFTRYLDQFIGQSREDIIKTIDFKQFGFSTITPSKVLQNGSQLVYSINRPLNIPIPIPETNFGGINGTPSGMKPTLHSMSNSYQVDLTCNIIFQLENNVVTKWEAKGRAC